MLPSPSHVVVGATDLEQTSEFLRLFGCEAGERGTLPVEAAGELYGLEGEAEEAVLATPGAERGWIRLVATPRSPRRFAPLDSRAFAIDFFTTDLDRSLALAAEAGHHASPVATHQFGPLTIREVEIRGPDELIVTLLETPARRPSILDREPERLHSEVHAFVWSAEGIDGLLPFWLDDLGLEKITDATFASPDMGKVLGVPDRQIEARLAVFCDADAAPIRLELIEFLGEPAASHPSLPLHGGLHAPAFTVDDWEAALGSLGAAELGRTVELDTPLHPGARAATAVAPGGLRFEIWQQGSRA